MGEPGRPQGAGVAVGVGAVVIDGNEILLMRRAQSHGLGTWSTPGGALDSGEDFESCARRETREEVGLELSDVRFLAVTNDVFESGRHFLTVWMAGRLRDPGRRTVVPNEEVAEHAWFAVDRLPTPLFLPLWNLALGVCHPPRPGPPGLGTWIRAVGPVASD